MPRTRPSARKRRHDRRTREMLQRLCAEAEEKGPDATAPTEGASPAAQDSAKTPESKPATDQPASSLKPKRLCKHRRLPNRYYFHRYDKHDYRYLAFQRRMSQLIDEKIADGHNTMAKWKRDGNASLSRFQNKVEHWKEMVELDVERIRRHCRTRLERIESNAQRFQDKVEPWKEMFKRDIEHLRRHCLEMIELNAKRYQEKSKYLEANVEKLEAKVKALEAKEKMREEAQRKQDDEDREKRWSEMLERVREQRETRDLPK
ncbi:hypothetical protein NM208_g15891 [Fusarium decemcellulare]|uniref:Uncharacterized protein n=1 Tax=Fusarium decemcellulare TaxID=57161 RepID=A0ACC1RDL5_9HYPO|nr:hypothetical protein NM208_g15891 [Fusarium decemcellulare]